MNDIGWWCLLPTILTVGIAALTRQVVLALLIGVGAGVIVLNGCTGSSYSLLLDTYLIQVLTDSNHVYVIVFSFLIGGMIHLIAENGGMTAVVYRLNTYAYTPRRAQFMAYVLGVAIFFDDYANTLIVGNTMRPITDRNRVSREKLSYIVDSTSAPVAAIAFISTWIGAELGYIQEAIQGLGVSTSPYIIFLNSLKYAFYPIFTLTFMCALILLKRDFGSMYKAEVMARAKTIEEDENGVQRKRGAWKAIIPIVTLLGITMYGLWHTGSNGSETWSLNSVSAVVGNADAYKSILWAAFGSLILAMVLHVIGRSGTLEHMTETVFNGFKTMLPAVTILVLAWVLAEIIIDLKTSDFLVSVFAGHFSAMLAPALIFVLSAVLAFATGSSWGCMAILYPMLVPMVWRLSADMPDDAQMELLYHTVSVILAGCIFGDHCSPISDTTILSSMASSCNHFDHVRTQLPYAITVAIVSFFIALIPVNLGFPWYANITLGVLFTIVIVRIFGRKVPD